MNYKKIRKDALKKISNPNQKIAAYFKGNEHFAFLQNLPAQIMYTQFCLYIQEICQKHFNYEDIKILDWGCGHGQCSLILKDLGLSVQAADVEKRPILENSDIPFKLLEHEFILPYPDNSFDVVTSFGVLEHVQNEPESLKEIFRILKPGGLFFCFNLPYFYSYGQRLAHLRGNYYHDRLYLESTIKKMAEQNNFDLLDFWHLGLFPKNTVNYGNFSKDLERIDQFLTRNTPLKYFATSLNFLGMKKINL